MPKIEVKSIPTKKPSHIKHIPGLGIYEDCGRRNSQEDAAYWASITDDTLAVLSPDEIAHRLWTSYKMLDAEVTKTNDSSGTTASTTVYDGRDHLITATLADSVAFAVVYDKVGDVLGVMRLNNTITKPSDELEERRIRAAGGFILNGRIFGSLAVSRAIGDKGFQPAVCADATIDITPLNTIYDYLQIDPSVIGKIQVITTCDGFTETVRSDKKEHEKYLFNFLKNQQQSPGNRPEHELAQALAAHAIRDGSLDNVSVAIQAVKANEAFMIGIYDGHGGQEAATFVAENIGPYFEAQCALTTEQYNAQQYSVKANRQIYYTRDNHRELEEQPSDNRGLLGQDEARQGTEKLVMENHLVDELITLTRAYCDALQAREAASEIQNCVAQLMAILKNKETDSKTKLEHFYQQLTASTPIEPGTDAPCLKDNLTYLDRIKQDKNRQAKDFIIGIALLANCIFVIPAIAMIGVYLSTGKSPFNLFKQTNSYETYTKALDVLETQVPRALEKEHLEEDRQRSSPP